MLFRTLLAVTIAVALAAHAHAADLVIEDTELKQGSIAIFSLTGVDTDGSVSAYFRGGDVFVRTDNHGIWGVVGVDLATAPGSYRLKVMAGGELYSGSAKVKDGAFKTERLTLPSNDKVVLSEASERRARREAGELSLSLKRSYPARLWKGDFIRPAKGRLSSNFGLRRILNGHVRSPHSGIDIAAPVGTRVVASNSGRVTFVGNFFFKGKFVVIDHGMGLYTSYSHLSKISVAEGEEVEKGDTIGAVGATGRATGPHLHFAAQVGKARVAPDELYRAAESLAALLDKKARLASAGE